MIKTHTERGSDNNKVASKKATARFLKALGARAYTPNQEKQREKNDSYAVNLLLFIEKKKLKWKTANAVLVFC